MDLLRSMISWAMRAMVRRMSSAVITILSGIKKPLASDWQEVKGTGISLFPLAGLAGLA
jgi:hypothetical protein